ncbi:MAG: aldo/keto reductase, partial [Gammaproteobacteria bacterium]
VRGMPLPGWASEFDCATWAQFFLKFILAQPAVTCVIPGTRRPHYMLDNARAGTGRLPDASMQSRMREYLQSL